VSKSSKKKKGPRLKKPPAPVIPGLVKPSVKKTDNASIRSREIIAMMESQEKVRRSMQVSAYVAPSHVAPVHVAPAHVAQLSLLLPLTLASLVQEEASVNSLVYSDDGCDDKSLASSLTDDDSYYQQSVGQQSGGQQSGGQGKNGKRQKSNGKKSRGGTGGRSLTGSTSGSRVGVGSLPSTRNKKTRDKNSRGRNKMMWIDDDDMSLASLISEMSEYNPNPNPVSSIISSFIISSFIISSFIISSLCTIAPVAVAPLCANTNTSSSTTPTILGARYQGSGTTRIEVVWARLTWRSTPGASCTRSILEVSRRTSVSRVCRC